MTAPEVDSARRVVVPRNVDGLVYGVAGESGTWFFENYGDLGVEVIEGKGGRVFRACEHDGARTISNLPDETVPLVEHVELLAKVEELHQRLDRLEAAVRTASMTFNVVDHTHMYGSVLTG